MKGKGMTQFGRRMYQSLQMGAGFDEGSRRMTEGPCPSSLFLAFLSLPVDSVDRTA